MPGYDLYLAARAWADVDALDEHHRERFEEIKEIFLQDPTEVNPLVAPLVAGFEDSRLMLVWRDVIVIYRFVNQLVIEIGAVGRRRPG